MRVGMNVATRHPFASSQASLALAEHAGMDSVWAPDHLLGTAHPALWPEMAMAPIATNPDAFLDPFVGLASLARDTTLPMGVCVTDAIRRRAPDVARTALSLHHLCVGGFHLGVGSGEAENLVPFGYDFATPVAQTEAFLAELRSLLDRGRMLEPHHGRVGLPTARDDIGTPPVWVASHGPRMLRLTGEYGDGWLPAWAMTPGEYAQRRAVIADHARAAGRPMPTCGLHIVIALGESREFVHELTERDPLGKLIALMCPAELWREYGVEHPAGPDCRGLVDLLFDELDPDELRALAPTIPFELLERFYFMGNANEIAERIAAYGDGGLEYAVLANATGFVGGLDEITRNVDQLVQLRELLRQM